MNCPLVTSNLVPLARADDRLKIFIFVMNIFGQFAARPLIIFSADLDTVQLCAWRIRFPASLDHLHGLGSAFLDPAPKKSKVAQHTAYVWKGKCCSVSCNAMTHLAGERRKISFCAAVVILPTCLLAILLSCLRLLRVISAYPFFNPRVGGWTTKQTQMFCQDLDQAP